MDSELKDSILRNPPWYHEPETEELQFHGGSSTGEALMLG